MSLLLDGLILLCAILCIANGIRQGFIRSLLGLIKGFVALLAAWAYTPVIQDTIKDQYIIRQIANGIHETLRSLALNLETQTYDLSKVANDLPEAYTSILTRYGIDIPNFTESIAAITQADEEMIYQCSTRIADPCATTVAAIVSWVLLFLGVYIGLTIVMWLADFIFRLPVLSEVNRFAGFLFGGLEAVFFALIIAEAGSALVAALEPIDAHLFGMDVIEKTVICKFLIEHNLFAKITDVMR